MSPPEDHPRAARSAESGGRSPSSPEPVEPTPTQKRRALWILAGVAAIAGGALFFSRRESPAPEKAGGRRAGADRPVPVTLAHAEARDVPVYLEGLGSVAAFNTVTVRSQVEGRILRVAFREGQEVKRGDLLAEIDPRPFVLQKQKAAAALLRDRAILDNTKLNLERAVKLREQKLVPEQQVDDLRAAVSQAQATVALDEAAVGDAELQLNYARIVAPIDGRTGVRLVDAGNLVSANDPNGLVIITQLDPISVLFNLPQDDLPDVAAAMKAGKLEVEAFSRDGRSRLGAGEVALIDNQINASTGTIRLKATFANPDHVLWPNQFVKARLLVRVRENALTVPAVVVQRGPNGTFAWVIGPEDKAEARPIEVELVTGDLALIASGLTAGERVVADGQYRLAPGSKVEPRKSTEKAISSTTTMARSGEGQ